MVDRLVAGRLFHAPDERVGRVIAERDVSPTLGTPEIAADGLADEQRERHAPPASLIPQLPVGVLREPEIGGHVLRHADMTISRYRDGVNEVRASSACGAGSPTYPSARSISGIAKYTTNAAEAT